MTLDIRAPRVAALGADYSQMLNPSNCTPKAAAAQHNHHHRIAVDIEERRRRREAEAAAGSLDAMRMARFTATLGSNQRRICWVVR